MRHVTSGWSTMSSFPLVVLLQAIEAGRYAATSLRRYAATKPACGPSAPPLSQDHLEGDKLRSRPKAAQNQTLRCRSGFRLQPFGSPAFAGSLEVTSCSRRHKRLKLSKSTCLAAWAPLKRLNINAQAYYKNIYYRLSTEFDP